tara:strand:- start:414 stop:761 length:348 start_codon:yes stop_codon:yes gene_type:complete
MEIKIYHNPRCSKSRQTLKLLKSKVKNFEIIEYLKTPLQVNEIKLILSKLDSKAIEIIRKQEPVWKNNYLNKDISEEEIIDIISKHPKLMERPIVTNKKKAIICRPPERVLTLFN